MPLDPNIVGRRDIRRSIAAHSLRRSLPTSIKRLTPRKKSVILAEIQSLVVSNIQDSIDAKKNKQLKSLIAPNKIRGPIDSTGTIKVRNKINIKCPPGSRINHLRQCVKIRSV